MNTWKKIIATCCLLALLIPAAGCKEEGAMESAGKVVDQMVKDAENSVNDAVSETKRKFGIHEPGPMEKLMGESGRALDELIWAAEEFIDKTMVDAKDFLSGTRK